MPRGQRREGRRQALSRGAEGEAEETPDLCEVGTDDGKENANL